MIPKSLSATSIQVFEACPARWVAEYFNRAPQPSSTHADLGTAVHGALERYVKDGLHAVHGSGGADNWSELADLFTEEYERLFDDQSRYAEGLQMCKRWYDRQDWTDRTVLSTEVKTNFLVKAKGNEVIFNYVWDRCDKIDNGDGTYDVEVIDYKTVSRPVSVDGLKNKIQARCYGLAGQIAYPEARRIWVTFDLLRFDPVGIVFTRDENIATWRYLQRTFARILDTDEETAPEVLNPECNWCIRKLVCGALGKHVDVGGVLGSDDPLAVSKMRFDLENQKKGIDAAIRDLDEFLLTYAEKNEVFEIEHPDLDVRITSKRSRALDSERVADIIGVELLAEYGSIGVTAVDKLLKDKRLSDSQREALKGLVRYKHSEPKIVVSAKNPIDSE